jgi:hypothetical protein
MEESRLYEELSDKHNFSSNQTKMLYEWCDKNLESLDLLLATVNYKLFHVVPDTKEEVEKLLKCEVEYQMLFRNNWYTQTKLFYDTFLSFKRLSNEEHNFTKQFLADDVRRLYNINSQL